MIRHPGGILVCYYTAGGASCIAWDSVGHSPTSRTSAVTGAVLPRYPSQATANAGFNIEFSGNDTWMWYTDRAGTFYFAATA